jgi:hypothetical protein
MTPLFSVVVATYNRGRHIVPTIASVLRQSLAEYELLVIGDGCTDDTEAVVRNFADERIVWRNLPQRSGSQSAPNNAGTALARGRYVAYLGHDDIWAPDHLATLGRCFEQHPEASFAVGGCIFYGPPGSGRYYVHGLFESERAPATHFFPPSSVAHRREVPELIGPWRRPDEVREPIDLEFMRRAFDSGLRFVSSGRITVHKFAAGHRYLSYMRQESQEQELLLGMMSEPGFTELVAAVLRKVEESGGLAAPKRPDFSHAEPGQAARSSSMSKGILRPPLQPLRRKMRLRQKSGRYALDWGPLQKAEKPHRRLSGPNPRPKLLIPVSSAETVDLQFDLLEASAGVVERLRLYVNGDSVSFRATKHPRIPGALVLRCAARLREQDYSIVEFDLTGGMPLDRLMRSISDLNCWVVLGPVRLRPRSFTSRLWLWLRNRNAKEPPAREAGESSSAPQSGAMAMQAD